MRRAIGMIKPQMAGRAHKGRTELTKSTKSFRKNSVDSIQETLSPLSPLSLHPQIDSLAPAHLAIRPSRLCRSLPGDSAASVPICTD